MMKRYARLSLCSFLFIIGLSSLGLSQNERRKEVQELPKYEFGFNASAVIHNVLGRDNILVDYPYNFLFNFRPGEGLFVRTGFNYSRRSENENENINTQRNFEIRVGLAQDLDPNKVFDMSFGFDILLGSGRSVSENTNNSNTNLSTLTYGFGPNLTLNYQLTPRISLRGESSFYYTQTTEELSFGNQSFNGFERSSSNIDLNPPLNILMFVNF
jgi:hypothetical protein